MDEQRRNAAMTGQRKAAINAALAVERNKRAAAARATTAAPNSNYQHPVKPYWNGTRTAVFLALVAVFLIMCVIQGINNYHPHTNPSWCQPGSEKYDSNCW